MAITAGPSRAARLICRRDRFDGHCSLLSGPAIGGASCDAKAFCHDCPRRAALGLGDHSASAATRTTSDVTLIADPSVVVGTSTLTRTESGISFTLETSGLQPGHAVTVWWMVVNPDGGVAVLYAAGHVIGDDGTTSFAGYLAVGDSTGWVMGDDTSLEDTLQATMYLVVRDHGPANPKTVNAQIHSFAACNASCMDLQMSVHQPS